MNKKAVIKKNKPFGTFEYLITCKTRRASLVTEKRWVRKTIIFL